MTTRPYAEFDGVTTPCSWRTPTTLATTPGTHHVRTAIRYRRCMPGDLGVGTLTLTAPDNGIVDVVATSGVTTDRTLTITRRP